MNTKTNEGHSCDVNQTFVFVSRQRFQAMFSLLPRIRITGEHTTNLGNNIAWIMNPTVMGHPCQKDYIYQRDRNRIPRMNCFIQSNQLTDQKPIRSILLFTCEYQAQGRSDDSAPSFSPTFAISCLKCHSQKSHQKRNEEDELDFMVERPKDLQTLQWNEPLLD